MKRRFIMAIIASIAIVALIKVALAEDHSSFTSDFPKISPVSEDPSTIMIQMDDPRQQKREVSSGTPRVMQPYTVIQAYPYRLPTASYPAPVTRPPRPIEQNCVKEFLINQLRETNDNINRLLECIKKNQNCEPFQPEAAIDQPYKPPSEPELCQPCQTEIERLAKTTTPNKTPCEDQPVTQVPSTPPMTFQKEYIKEESEEVDTNRYSSAKRFPTSSCEQSQEIVTEKPTTKPTRKRCRKPIAVTTKKCGCRTSRKPTTTTTTTTTTTATTRKPTTKKISSVECKCVYCVEDGTCAGGYD